jgi:hypothetical protein
MRVTKKIPFVMGEMERGGSRECPPWAASPAGGERGSPSYSLQNVNKNMGSKRISTEQNY